MFPHLRAGLDDGVLGGVELLARVDKDVEDAASEARVLLGRRALQERPELQTYGTSLLACSDAVHGLNF